MYYSQKTYTWLKLGTSNQTVASVGCYMTSFSNLLLHLGVTDISPDILNTYLVKNGGFVNGNMFNSDKCASLFGMNYKKATKLTGIKYPEVVICETDHYKKYNVPQHFFLYRPKDRMRIDPLDKVPDWEQNDYNIVSYRLFYPASVESYKPVEKPSVAVVDTPDVQIPAEKVETSVQTISGDITVTLKPSDQSGDPKPVYVNIGGTVKPVTDKIEFPGNAGTNLTESETISATPRKWFERIIDAIANFFGK